MRVFLGITGASGAPYAARLLQALAGAGCEVGVCRLGRRDRGARDRALRRSARSAATRCSRRVVGDAQGVTVYAPDDWSSPYASGSAQVDAYVICPCSMATVGTLASGRDGQPHPPRRLGRAQGRPPARAHAARDAALGDPPPGAAHACARRARRSSSWRRASTTAPQSIDDLVDFVVGRASTSWGFRTNS